MTDFSLYLKFSVLPKEVKEQVKLFIDKLMLAEKMKGNPHKRKAGFLKGTFEMSNDFDDPIEDFKDYM